MPARRPWTPTQTRAGSGRGRWGQAAVTGRETDVVICRIGEILDLLIQEGPHPPCRRADIEVATLEDLPRGHQGTGPKQSLWLEHGAVQDPGTYTNQA